MPSHIMALDGGGRDSEIRSQFTTREGIYKQMPNSEYCRPNRTPYTAQGPPSSFTPVKASFADIKHNEAALTRIVFTIGRDLFYFNYEGVFQPVDLTKPLDKRTYKGVAPTCHDINKHIASVESVIVAVGFAAGQVQIIDVGTKQSLQILNEERMVDKIATTCVKWVPNSESLLISSHANGHMYTYDSSQENMNVVPQYHEKPFKTCGDISIYTLKSKSYTSPTGVSLGVLKNPVHKWLVTRNNCAIHEFQFSPDGRTIAIVSQDGFLRVLDHKTFETRGSMKSYFGGLLCCCWSPDGRYIVTGGEDDLITVWSFYGGFVLARGHGHRSWVSNVAFDKFSCSIPDEDEVLNWYGGDSPALTHNDSRSKESTKDTPSELKSKLHHRDNIVVENLTKSAANDCAQFSKKTTTPLNRRDLRSPVSELHELARRQRRDSIVSRISRISFVGSVDAPPRVSYRFGSVGQDAQLCLWELTDEVLFPRRKTVSMLHSYGSVHSRGRGEIFCSHFLKPKYKNIPSPINGSHAGTENSHSDTGSTLEHRIHSIEGKAKHSKSNGLPNSMTPTKEHTSTISRGLHFFSSKGNHSTNAEKFATIGSNKEHNPRKNNVKEHKRNLSMPHFGSRNSHHSQASSNGIPKNLDQNKKQQAVKTLGTVLCPRLDETEMLEPLVCKRITQGLLTCISFQRDSIVTACQDGFIQTWARPQQNVLQQIPTSPATQLASSSKSPSSPPKALPPQAKAPGTIV